MPCGCGAGGLERAGERHHGVILAGTTVSFPSLKNTTVKSHLESIVVILTRLDGVRI